MRRQDLLGHSILAAAFLAVGICPTTGLAQAGAAEEPISTPYRLIPNFDILNIVPVLDELGVRHELRESEDGRPYLSASIGESFAFNIAPTACLSSDFSRCIGLNIVTFFYAPGANLQTVSAFSQENAFASVGLMSREDTVFLLRYEIADYGIPRGNFASGLARFVGVAQRLESELSSSPKTVSAKGYASDLSARALNGDMLRSFSGGRSAPANIHDASLEAAAAFAETLLRDGAPVNEIGGPQPR